MQIEIDPLSPVAIYQQIRDRVVEAIASGALRGGDQLVSVRRLAIEFGVNVATVSKAYDMLRAESLIVTNHKSGSIVAHDPSDAIPTDAFALDWERRAATLLAEAIDQGMTDTVVVERLTRILDGFATSRARAADDPLRAIDGSTNPAAHRQKDSDR